MRPALHVSGILSALLAAASVACGKPPDPTPTAVCAALGARLGGDAGGPSCVEMLAAKKDSNLEDFACTRSCLDTARDPVDVSDCELACGPEMAKVERLCMKRTRLAPDAGPQLDCMLRLETMHSGFRDRYRCVNHCVLTARDAEAIRSCEVRCGG